MKNSIEVAKTVYGHKVDSQAGKIDLLLTTTRKHTITVTDFAKAIPCTVSRLREHFLHLRVAHDVVVKLDAKKKVVIFKEVSSKKKVSKKEKQFVATESLKEIIKSSSSSKREKQEAKEMMAFIS